VIRIRRLTDAGVAAYEAALDQLAQTGESSATPIDPTDPALSEPHPIPLQIDEQRHFENRFDCAAYLFSIFGTGQIENVEQDFLLWSWMSVVWFDQLCPANGHGRRELKQRARYVPSADYNKAYRHLLLGPYRIYQAHAADPSMSLVALTGQIDAPGELAEQLAGRREVISTPSVLGAATLLYIDANNRTPKRGAAGAGRGAARRFGKTLKQYDLTWDLAGLTPQEIVNLLPAEYDRFRRAPTT
jgi:hypothetical protein